MNQAVGPAPEPASQRQAAKHEWLRERLLQDIAGLHPRSPLPTERELASTYEVSRATVRQALAALEQSGTVYRVQGAGTFVAGPHVSKSLSLTSFSEDMRLRGLRPSSLVLAADEVPADAAIAGDLQIPVAASVVRLVRVRLADEYGLDLTKVEWVTGNINGTGVHGAVAATKRFRDGFSVQASANGSTFSGFAFFGNYTSRIDGPGKVFDLELPLEQVAEGYRAMDERRAIKTLLHP